MSTHEGIDQAQLFSVLAESAPDAILVIDGRSTVLSANAAAERLFGRPAAEIVGQPLAQLMPERLRGGHRAGVAHYLATGRRNIPWQGVRVPILTAAGDEIPVEISFGEFTSRGERYFSGFIRDVSERIAAERALEDARREAEGRAAEAGRLAGQLAGQALELERQVGEARTLRRALEHTNAELRATARVAEQARDAAEQANRAKTDFLGVMSHELRTPLNAITGYVQLMELGIRGPVSDEQRSDLARVRRSADTLISLVNDVLNFARVDAGRVDIDVRDVRLGAVVSALEAMVLPQVAARGLAYDVECGDDVEVRADPERLQQVLLNLLTNAIKFTEPGGRVRLACAREGDLTHIRVEDTGKGIPADQLGRIFDPFVQVDRRGSRESQQGVGLGLAISRDLALHMGGDIAVRSEPGVGSTFTLTLPCCDRQGDARGTTTAA